MASWRAAFPILYPLGRIMGSPMACGLAASLILRPENISKTILATVMKLHGWIDLMMAESSAQES